MFERVGLEPAVAIVLGDLQHHERPQKGSQDNYPANKPTEHQVFNESSLADSNHEKFEPFIFTSWKCSQAPPWLNRLLIQPYIWQTQDMVRRPSDIIYISHLLVLCLIGLPNLILLFAHFSWIHAVLHELLVLYFLGPYTIIMHHHLHGRGILSPRWASIDASFPYILGPLMGQTWNSFYYHHKHHHVEDNGPDDLSSTLRYQRDSTSDLCIYLARFVLLNWFELPWYYIRKGKPVMGLKYFGWEVLSLGFIALLVKYNGRAAMAALVLPLIQWRVLVMMNNWGQHTFVDEVEPTSKFRFSVTLIGAVANRHSLNDGYHTSHHLSPRRHWRDHPFEFIKAWDRYSNQEALIVQNVNFISLAILLCRKSTSILRQNA
ncbi:hypothetical protein HYALB_00002628 [Hymenoscyphus albidus]|uniref:Fatty acid desaturase domain-containing protein n=1 Tax=Hymenoscyphus albidus TaxID=595503 RepID=A0A9N9LVG8_9HELO|nr:hypothetical protein HYALB_00002628 [Hymenoscyphus albidus]